MARRICTVGLVAVASVALLGGCSSDKKEGAADDVTVSKCSPDPAGGGRPSADGGIMNHSSKDSTYAFTVAFKDPSGNRVSEGAVAVGEVKAGASATWHTEGATSAKGPLTCEITKLSRTARP